MKQNLFCALTAFALSFVFLLILIPILRKMKAGQNILVYVEEHKLKGGTPTMGGLAFIFAAVIASALFIRKLDRTLVITYLIGISYMIVGLLDDFLKKKRRENLGLRAWQKFLFQVLIAIFSGIYCYRSGLTKWQVPFVDKSWEIGWFVVPMSAFIFVAIVNAVNLTDGLDGLAAGVSVPFFLCFGILAILQDGEALGTTSFALVGSLMAYLLFNAPPASVFMGDTGSLALGGFAAAIAIFSENALYLPIIGACFVFSVISVMIQVIYYKATGGKRVFLMAPAHHHFQKKGYSESRISYAYFTITGLLGAVCIAFAL